MKLKALPISTFFFMVFALYFVEQIYISYQQACTEQTPLCINRACAYKNLIPLKDKSNSNSKLPLSKVMDVSCEILFLTPNTHIAFHCETPWSWQAFFFKNDIHSPPYISLQSPPPISVVFTSTYI